jgi:hypothetical protein
MEALKGPLQVGQSLIHVAADQTGQLIGQQILRPHEPAAAVVNGKDLTRSVAGDERPVWLGVDEPADVVVNADESLPRLSAATLEGHNPRISVELAVSKQARHERVHLAEVADLCPGTRGRHIDDDVFDDRSHLCSPRSSRGMAVGPLSTHIPSNRQPSRECKLVGGKRLVAVPSREWPSAEAAGMTWLCHGTTWSSRRRSATPWRKRAPMRASANWSWPRAPGRPSDT